ncbi:MAG: hypothetical protein JXR10_02510 [Cyclobacteriaceae bacterium]
MKRLFTIFSFSVVLVILGQYQAKGQLITDSESKLKTQKTKSKGGFSLFGNKKKGARSSSGPQQNKRSSAPNFSSQSPFASMQKRKSASPRVSQNRATLFKNYQKKAPRYSSSGLASIVSKKRPTAGYSSGSPFSNRSRIVTPRYSAGSPFSNKRVAGGTRYSTGSPFSNKQVSASPRYSTGNPFSNKRVAASPRYSAGNPFSNKRVASSPRYSSGNPFSNKRVASSPRYSAGNPFSNKRVAASPRYSAGNPFPNTQNASSPRYSIGMPFTSKDVKADPRYSAGSPYLRYSWNWIKPRYSTNEHRFEVNKKKRQEYVYLGIEANFKGFSRKRLNWAIGLENLLESSRSAAFESRTKLPRFDPKQPDYATSYTGDFKLKWIKHNEMHPSSKYHKANQNSEMLRNSMRKRNLMWSRLNRNKQQPNAVTDKISKPKFDRKEAEIWNE